MRGWRGVDPFNHPPPPARGGPRAAPGSVVVGWPPGTASPLAVLWAVVESPPRRPAVMRARRHPEALHQRWCLDRGTRRDHAVVRDPWRGASRAGAAYRPVERLTRRQRHASFPAIAAVGHRCRAGRSRWSGTAPPLPHGQPRGVQARVACGSPPRPPFTSPRPRRRARRPRGFCLTRRGGSPARWYPRRGQPGRGAVDLVVAGAQASPVEGGGGGVPGAPLALRRPGPLTRAPATPRGGLAVSGPPRRSRAAVEPRRTSEGDGARARVSWVPPRQVQQELPACQRLRSG